MIKTLHKLGIDGPCINTVKATQDRPTARIPNCEQFRAFPLGPEQDKEVPSRTPRTHSTAVPASAIRQDRETEDTKPERSSTIISLVDDRTFRVENPKDSTETLLNESMTQLHCRMQNQHTGVRCPSISTW